VLFKSNGVNTGYGYFGAGDFYGCAFEYVDYSPSLYRPGVDGYLLAFLKAVVLIPEGDLLQLHVVVLYKDVGFLSHYPDVQFSAAGRYYRCLR
jgi:hypothetical protein